MYGRGPLIVYPAAIVGFTFLRAVSGALTVNGTLETPKFYDPQDWIFVHIPKTGGISLLTDSAEHLPTGSTLMDNGEQAFSSLVENNNTGRHYIMTLLREPSSHVLSQFLMCKYDDWGKAVTKHSNFPGYGQSATILGGFHQWLEHFLEIVSSGDDDGEMLTDRHRLEEAFGCYDPWNMQTRYFTADCASGSINAHVAKSEACRRSPSIDEAKRNLAKLEVVGLTEHYSASVCLLEFHATSTLSSDCRTCRDGRLVASLRHHRIAHNVPPHNVSMLDDSALSLVKTLTKVDRELYGFADKVFHRDVDRVRTEIGVDLLCRGDATADYHPSSKDLLSLPRTPVAVLRNSCLLVGVGAGIIYFSRCRIQSRCR